MSTKTIISSRKFHCQSNNDPDCKRIFESLLKSKLPRVVFGREGKYLAVLRNSFKITIQDNQASLDNLETSSSLKSLVECPFAYLDNILENYKKLTDKEELEDSLSFKGGLIGYLGFGLTESLLSIPKQKDKFIDVPDSIFYIPGCFAQFDFKNQIISIASDRDMEELENTSTLLMNQSYGDVKQKESSKAKIDNSPLSLVKPAFTESDYIKKVEEAKQYIKDGEAFQIVLAQRLSVELPANFNGMSLISKSSLASENIYNYYFNFENFQYTGFSPESFLKVKKNKISLKALAGTKPRGKTESLDRYLEKELVSSSKENAEHLMLVDLGRNDLGRVSLAGSIKVGNIAEVLRYENVMHLSTDIESLLLPDKTSIDAVKSCFPRGTVSGAPKRRALSILSKLEPEQRGVYSGCVGTIDTEGDVDLAIAIRSATIKDNIAHIQAGAGIVYDSDPKQEYQETIHKAKSVIEPLTKILNK